MSAAIKKYRLVIILAIIAAALVIIFFPSLRGFFPAAGRGVVEVASLPGGREYSLDELVPARAGLMIRLRSMAALWERLTSGRFFAELKSSPLWREEKIERRLESVGRGFEARAGFGISRTRIMQVAGEDLALAVVPSGGDSPDALLVLSRLGTRARLMEIFLRLGDSLKAEEERLLQEEVYRGERIVIIPPAPELPTGLAYCLLDGYLAAALSAAPVSLIREVIDLSHGERQSLAGSLDYSAALDRSGFPAETCLEFYLRPGRYPSGLDGLLPPGPWSEGVAWAEVIVQSLNSARALGLRAGYREGVRTRLRIIPPADGSLPPPLAVPVREIPLPAGEMLYGFFSFDPARVAERLSGLAEAMGFRGGADAFPGLAEWEKESGIDLRRDILPCLSGRLGLVVGGLTGGEFLPLPPFALTCALSDRAAAEAAMAKVVAWSVLVRGLRPVREVDNGVDLTFFPGLFFIEPGYAFLDEELVIAGSRAMLKKMLVLRAGDLPPVQSQPDFRQAAAGFDPAAGAAFYLDGGIFPATLRAAAEWYFEFQRLAPENPIIPESLYREKISPLLDLLGNLRGVSGFVVREKSIVKTDCFLYIPGSD